REEVPNNSSRVTKATTMEENDDGFTEVKSRKKKKGVDFGGIRLNKPKSKLEDEDFDFYEGYADQVVDIDGALKEFRDFKLRMS
nr:hypothetical protein [Tanacetum cinerariifolium]